MSFTQTEAAISEVLSNLPQGMGGHIEERVRAGVFGLTIGEVPFNPTIHDPEAIKPFSFMEEVAGVQYVDQVLPKRPTEVNLVLDYGNRTDIDDIARAKHQAMHSIGDGIESALGVGDKLYEYAIGVDERVALRPSEMELEGLENSEEYRAESVGMLCMNGLTLVVSDFHKLPLADYRADYSNTLAVKLNHPLERRFPANVGVIGIGGDQEVDTDNPRRLRKVNELLEARHQSVVSKLQASGIRVVSLVTDGRTPAGIDLEQADYLIAQGVNSLMLN